MKLFVCRNQKCYAVEQIEDNYVQQEGDEPRCPRCGDKDSFQDTTNIHSLLPEPKPPADAHPAAIAAHEQRQAKFVVKDSGKRQDFATGARRDTQDGKGDFSLLPPSWLLALAKEMQRRNEPNDRLDLVPVSPLLRLSAVYGRGSAKYDETPSAENPAPQPNWQRGIPMSRYVSSLHRHLIAYAEGDQSEDHMAQAMWNAAGLLWTEEAVRAGRLPRDMGDWGPLADPNCRVVGATGISSEPNGHPILPLKDGFPLCRFGIQQDEWEKVVLRRGGAVLVGWVKASHLSPLTPSA